MQGIEVCLYSFVQQLLFQCLKSSCSVGEKRLYPVRRPTHTYCKPGLGQFIKLSKDQDVPLLLTATPDHKKAQGLDAETPFMVVTEDVLWLKPLKPSQT